MVNTVELFGGPLDGRKQAVDHLPRILYMPVHGTVSVLDNSGRLTTYQLEYELDECMGVPVQTNGVFRYHYRGKVAVRWPS